MKKIQTWQKDMDKKLQTKTYVAIPVNAIITQLKRHWKDIFWCSHYYYSVFIFNYAVEVGDIIKCGNIVLRVSRIIENKQNDQDGNQKVWAYEIY